MRVIGIDPGLATTGFAVVERRGARLTAVAFGAARTSSDRSEAERLLELRAQLGAVVARHEPTVAAVERLFVNANVRTATAVGRASGIALLAAAEAGLEVAQYTPTEVKASVVGVGAAAKSQVQAMVAALLDLDSIPQPADAADACAVAICHLHRSGLRRAVTRASGAAPGPTLAARVAARGRP
jgi:crossover junction endodeoxyribonuclease RuvC